MRVHRVGGRHSFAVLARSAVRSLLAARRYDAVVEDINKLPLYLPTLTRLPLYAIVPHLFGTTAFVEASWPVATRSEEHTSELQSLAYLVCRLLLEKKKHEIYYCK